MARASSSKRTTIRFVPPWAVDRLLELLREGRISRAALVVGVVLATFVNSRSRRCWPSRAAIAARAGIDRRNVSRHLRVLERVGFISTEHRGWTSNRYTILAGGTPDAPEAPLECQPPLATPVPPPGAADNRKEAKEGTREEPDTGGSVSPSTAATPDLAWAAWVRARADAGVHPPVRSRAAKGAAGNLARSVNEGELTMGELERSMQDYLADDDEFLRRNGHSLRFLHGLLDRYLAGDAMDRDADAASRAYAESPEFDEIERVASEGKKGETP